MMWFVIWQSRIRRATRLERADQVPRQTRARVRARVLLHHRHRRTHSSSLQSLRNQRQANHHHRREQTRRPMMAIMTFVGTGRYRGVHQSMLLILQLRVRP